MRQGQQNRRGRGRNRKSQNPLTRSFESNGPDVKIRGTPSHIAEKYISMARDALASGDPVLAENHLQHAEHYNRIIMTFREQQVAQEGMNGNGRHRQQAESGDGDDQQFAETEEMPPGQEPQPSVSGAASDEAPSETATERPQRRMNGSRGGSRRRRSEPANGQATETTAAVEDDGGAASSASDGKPSRRRESFGDGDEQPDFLKRSVRRPRRSQEASDSDAATGDDGTPAPSDEAAGG
ncbi:MAG: DUF4167 domain-containing protein [Hyphomicrobiaceae bacterium]